MVVQQGRHARNAVVILFPMPVDKARRSFCNTTSALQALYLLILSLHVVIRGDDNNMKAGH